MRYLLINYLIFIIIVALLIAYLVSRLQIKFQGRFLLIILLIITSPVVISYFILAYFSPLSETIVPNIVGLSEKDARERLEGLGLIVNVEKKYEGEDLVTFQRPEAGRLVKEGRAVTIIVGRPKTIEYIPSPSRESSVLATEEGQSTEEGENTE